MSTGAAGAGAGAGAAGAAAAIGQAIKASGAIVSVEPQVFENLLQRHEEAPLVVVAHGGFFSPKYQYLTSYKGLFFHTKSPEPIALSEDCEVIESRKIWIPG